jgi:hypothetical protein
MTTETIYIRFQPTLSKKEVLLAAKRLARVPGISSLRRCNEETSPMARLWYYADVPVENVDRMIGTLKKRATINSARQLLESFMAVAVIDHADPEAVSAHTFNQLSNLKDVFTVNAQNMGIDEQIFHVYARQGINADKLKQNIEAIAGIRQVLWEPRDLVAL